MCDCCTDKLDWITWLGSIPLQLPPDLSAGSCSVLEWTALTLAQAGRNRCAGEGSPSQQAAAHGSVPSYLRRRGRTQTYVAITVETWLNQISHLVVLWVSPCTLWSLDIQYRTPSDPCFIFSVSDRNLRRFLLTFISFFSDLCSFTSSCSHPSALSFFPSFPGTNFCCLAAGSFPAGPDVALRFLSDMMVSPVNDLIKREETRQCLWLLWVINFNSQW